MKPYAKVLLASALVALWMGGRSRAAEPTADVVAAVKASLEGLTEVDKADAAARTALQAALTSLDTTRFGSAAYNARVTAQQVESAQATYEEAGPEQKEQALEAYELAQELAAQRTAEHEAALKLLPQREAEAKAAEERYNAVLAGALELAGKIKSFLRQSEGEAQARLQQFKQATENAALAKAEAEQGAAAGAQVNKLLAELDAASAAWTKLAAALQKASEEERSTRRAEAEKVATAYAAALHAAATHLPALPEKLGSSLILKATTALVQADANLQRAKTDLEQAEQNLKNITATLAQAEARVEAAKEAVETRIAKLRARKDLEREQEAVVRTAAAKKEAESELKARTEALAKVEQQRAAAMAEAIKVLLLSPEANDSLEAERRTIAAAIAARRTAIEDDDKRRAAAAAEAQAAADKAQAALVAAEKRLNECRTVRESQSQILRKRYLRDTTETTDEQRRIITALASANRVLTSKVSAFNRASADAAKAQQQVAARAQELAAAKKQHEAADKRAQELAEQQADAEGGSESAPAAVAGQELEKAVAAQKAAKKRLEEQLAAAKTAEKQLAEAQANLKKATAEKTAAEREVQQLQTTLNTATADLAVAKAGAYGGLPPLPPGEWNYAQARHLLVRAGFGGTPEEVSRLHALGLHGAVEYLVYFKQQPSTSLDFAASPRDIPTIYENGLSSDERRRLRDERAARDRRQLTDMRAWWLQRMIESPRPLEEKLALFWHGHFASQYSDVGDSYYMYLQNQLLRDHAAGNFATLLYGIAHDAAMLKYLNNDTNVRGRANENLAREIMELFSMGRDQGYHEDDIRQGARALTGYTYDSQTGQFRYLADRHDEDPKTVFGKQGNWCGDDFVRLILATPHPPKFIARQLFIFFAHDEPSPDTVEALANVLRLNNYELTPLLENLFLSAEFYSPRSTGTHVKGPVELIVGLHRDLGLTSPDLAYCNVALRDMGQELFEPPSVFGWQAGHSWISTSRIFSRYNALAEILERRPRAGKAGVDVVGTLLAGKALQDHAEAVDYLTTCCLDVPLSAEKRQALIEFLAPLPPPAQWEADPSAVNMRLTRMLAMLMCSPEYQLN